MEEAADVLAAMAAQVKRGNFAEAAELGNGFRVPLGVPAAELRLGEQLHGGQQGAVRRGTWRGADVAVKVARLGTSADLERFRKEVQLMAGLGSHGNVVPLLAARVLPPGYMLVLPFAGDSLADALHSHGWRPGWAGVLQAGLQLARGLAHIHACGVLHRDIKPANVLLGGDGRLRICDFGIAERQCLLEAEQADRGSLVGRGAPSGGFHKRHLVGTLEYLAPEVLLKQAYSFPADVYAWAVSVNEVATATAPFSDCTKDNPAAHTVLNFGYGRQELAAAVVSEGLRPHMAPDTPPALAALLESAWQLDPSQRPAAQQLVQRLQALLGSEHPPAPLRPLSERERQAARVAAVQHSGVQSAESQAGESETWPPAPAWVRALQPPQGFQQQVRAGAFETAGSRGPDRMEDAHCLACPLPCQPPAHLLAVFDGHRGAAAARHAATGLPACLRAAWAGAGSAEQALQASFAALDASYCAAEAAAAEERQARLGTQAGRSYAGCTALAALLLQDRLWVANAGDCRAVLCRGGQALQLNAEHSADSAAERQRIEAAGGELRRVNGGWRIGAAGIQVTRSLGDADLRASGLTPEPEVTRTRLTAGDAFLVLASDGLWERLSSQDAVDLVRDTVKDPAMCARRLATEALTRGSGDNITVLVAFLQPVSTFERIFAAGQATHAPAATHWGGR